MAVEKAHKPSTHSLFLGIENLCEGRGHHWSHSLLSRALWEIPTDLFPERLLCSSSPITLELLEKCQNREYKKHTALSSLLLHFWLLTIA